jgi:hypothetical protein
LPKAAEVLIDAAIEPGAGKRAERPRA